MPDSKVNPAFALLVKSRLARKGLAAATLGAAVKVPPSLMSRILAARRYPPENLDSWADFLELSGDERERFLEEGYLTRCHPYIVALVERQRKELEQLRGQHGSHQG